MSMFTWGHSSLTCQVTVYPLLLVLFDVSTEEKAKHQ